MLPRRVYLPLSVLLALQVAACSDGGKADSGDPSTTATTGSTGPVDLDGDGFSEDEDCDDSNAAVHPAADELCNGIDDDCDGVVDDSAALDATEWFADLDADGFGDASAAAWACEAPSGHVGDSSDCDDADGTVFPGAPEVCGDARINDCAGTLEDAVAACPVQWPETTADADVSWEGADASWGFGQSVSISGDLDGDGLADVLVGDPRVSTIEGSEGRVYVDLGGALSDSDGGGPGAQATVDGEWYGGRLGQSVDIVRDINADGFDDILLGAPTAGSGSEGRAQLFLGPMEGVLSESDRDVTVYGTSEASGFGQVVVSLGDFNGDGPGDIAIAAPTEDDGVVYLWSGSEDGVSGDAPDTSADAMYWLANGVAAQGDRSADKRVAPVSAHVGQAVAGVGDVNGDGLDDMLVAAPHAYVSLDQEGEVFLVHGGESLTEMGGALRSVADAVIQGEEAYGLLGSALAGAGDVDGDGLDDVLVGAPGVWVSDESVGEAYVFLGAGFGEERTRGVADADRTIQASGDAVVGGALSGAGDVNDDGLADVLVGAPSWTEDSTGAVHLFVGGEVGSTDLSAAHATLRGQEDELALGLAVDGGHDLDGDGLEDLITASPYLRDSDGGRVHTLFGDNAW